MIAFTANSSFNSVSFKVNMTMEQLAKVIDKVKGNKEISFFGTAFFKAALAVDPDVALGGEPNWTTTATDRVIYNVNSQTVGVQDGRSIKDKFPKATISDLESILDKKYLEEQYYTMFHRRRADLLIRELEAVDRVIRSIDHRIHELTRQWKLEYSSSESQ